MLFLRWGKWFKHGCGGVKPNSTKALDSFLNGAARGSTLAMVDAGLVYWEMGKKEEGIVLYMKAAELGDPVGQCNLGISYLQVQLIHQGSRMLLSGCTEPPLPATFVLNTNLHFVYIMVVDWIKISRKQLDSICEQQKLVMFALCIIPHCATHLVKVWCNLIDQLENG